MTNTRLKIVLLGIAALCLNLKAQVRFPLDDAAGIQGAVVMPGAVGNAVRFNGYSSYVKKSYNPASLSAKQQTISLWCAVETYPMMNAQEAENAFSSIIETIDEIEHTGFALRLSSQGNLKFECYSEGWKQTLETEALLPKYQWNHIVITLDADRRESVFYCNGKILAQGRTMSQLSAGTGTMLIGKDSRSLFYSSFMLNTFNGLIDDVRIDNRILTQEEIADVEPQNPADLIFPQDAFYANMLRPHFHAMPMMGWTNETHGMTYRNGVYHLFFQKNPNGPYMARLHWGHLISSDLCGWTEQPIAVAPSEDYDIKGCWSGCVFTDSLLTRGEPWIAYTGVDNRKATIDFAMPASADLLTWEKPIDNPQINGRPVGLTDDFRDPYFFRTPEGAYMIVGSSRNGVGVTTLHRFQPDGSLTNDGTLFFEGNDPTVDGTFFEMPNLTPMGDKWLFTTTPLGSQNGVRTVYWIGTIDNTGHFVPDDIQPRTVELQGMAREGYGMLSPTIYQSDSLTVALGIVPDKLPAAVNYELGWAHSYSLPREWSLSSDGSLVQKPYRGLTALRYRTVVAESALSLSSGTYSAQVANPLQVELEADFTIGNSDCGFSLLDGNLKIIYRVSDNSVVVDFSTLQRRKNDATTFDGLYSSILPRKINSGERINMHIYLDHSVLDIFINNEWASSVRLFPTSEHSNEVALVGKEMVYNVGIYDLETTVAPKSYILTPAESDQTGLDDALESIDSTDAQQQGCYTILGQPVCKQHVQPNKIYILDGKKVVTLQNN